VLPCTVMRNSAQLFLKRRSYSCNDTGMLNFFYNEMKKNFFFDGLIKK
jgi:hypothetical protein